MLTAVWQCKELNHCVIGSLVQSRETERTLIQYFFKEKSITIQQPLKEIYYVRCSSKSKRYHRQQAWR